MSKYCKTACGLTNVVQVLKFAFIWIPIITGFFSLDESVSVGQEVFSSAIQTLPCVALVGLGYWGYIKNKIIPAGLAMLGGIVTFGHVAILLMLIGAHNSLSFYIFAASIIALFLTISYIYVRGFLQVCEKRKSVRVAGK